MTAEHVNNTTGEVVSIERPFLSEEEIALLKRTMLAGAPADQVDMAIAMTNRLRLDPFARQVFYVKRRDDAGRDVVAVQVSIDGFRLIAERSGRYAGQVGPHWLDKDGNWHEAWPYDTPPVAARVGVLKHGFTQPLYGVARFNAYAARRRDGGLMKFWAAMPEVMIGKVAEALALRRAFPSELSGVYVSEEMDQAQNPVAAAEPPMRNTPVAPMPPVRSVPAAPAQPEGPDGDALAAVKAAAEAAGLDKAALSQFCRDTIPGYAGFTKLTPAQLRALALALRAKAAKAAQDAPAAEAPDADAADDAELPF
jgi:phage recombination protein Bet